MSVVIAVTGTRRETCRGVISRELELVRPTHIVLGDCPTGVDAEALAWAKASGVTPVVVHALWDWYAKTTGSPHEAGPRRNIVIARVARAMRARECIAVPDLQSKGTHQCARACTRWRVPARYAGPFVSESGKAVARG